MDEGGLGLGAVLADLGANLVTVLLILLALAMAMNGAGRQDGTRTYPVEMVPTLSGRAQSDLLFQRLRPAPDTLIIEVRRQGVVWIDGGRSRPLRDLPAKSPERAVVFVLSPAHYARLRDGAAGLPADRVEMTVPQALQQPGGDGFSSAFLSIRAGAEPATIRPELKRLLTQGGLGRVAAGATVEEDGGGAGSFAWLIGALRLMGNLALLILTLGLLRWMWRRTRPAL